MTNDRSKMPPLGPLSRIRRVITESMLARILHPRTLFDTGVLVVIGLAFGLLRNRRMREQNQIQVLAEQARIAAHSAERRIQAFRALNDVAEAATRGDELAALARHAIGHACELLEVDGASIFVWNPDREVLVPFEADNSTNLNPLGELRSGQSASGRAFALGAPCVIEDYHNSDAKTPWGVARGTQSLAAVPIISQDRPIGALSVRSLTRRTFDSEHMQLLSLFASQIGPALEAADQRSVRGRAEKELRASEARYRQLFDDAPIGYHELDSDGCITRVNETELAMLGYTREEMLGRPIFEFIVNAEVEIAKVMYQRKLQSTGPMASFERRYRRRNGTEIPLLLEDRILRDENGNGIGVRTTLQDISALKLVEEKIRAADILKSEFVSLVSHELRTPLTSIKGYVDLLTAGEVGDMEEEQLEFLHIIKSNADRLVALINDLLDVSRIESGKLELQYRTTDLAQLVKNVASSMRPQIDEKRQKLVVEVPDREVIGNVDPDRITQVVTNLLSNAHKYTPAGGQLSMIVRVNGPEFQLDVIDSGVGLSEDDLTHLFGRFWRAHNSATREVGGTGLGLMITKSLIEMHGGAISVASTPDVGSAFTVKLPVMGSSADLAGTVETQPRDEPRSATSSTRGERILVVEDEPEIAQLIRRYLENGGYTVLIATNGVAALKMAREEQPDLITLDILLPGADGFTVLDWLRKDPLTSSIAVVVLSITEDSLRGRTLGAADYITKPVDQGELLYRVGVILERNLACQILVPSTETNELTPLSSP